MGNKDLSEQLDREGKLCCHCGKRFSECKGHGYIADYYNKGEYEGD